MDDVIDGVRRVINKWINTFSPLIEDVQPGDELVKVKSSLRFLRNDQVMLTNRVTYETDLRVRRIIDRHTVLLSRPVSFSHTVAEGAGLVKSPNEKFVGSIHFGDPSVLLRFPAITVMGDNESSEWLTVGSSKETFNLTIGVYTLDSNHEESFREVISMARILKTALQRNIFPLVSDFEQTAVISDITGGDTVIRVADASVLAPRFFITIEDSFKSVSAEIKEIIDKNHIEIATPIQASFFVDDEPIVILPIRCIYNSWPTDIDYGFVHKNTMLKAAQIKWFANIQTIQIPAIRDPTFLN